VNGYKIINEVLEMASPSADYASKMMIKALRNRNSRMYNKWKMIFIKAKNSI